MQRGLSIRCGGVFSAVQGQIQAEAEWLLADSQVAAAAEQTCPPAVWWHRWSSVLTRGVEEMVVDMVVEEVAVKVAACIEARSISTLLESLSVGCSAG